MAGGATLAVSGMAALLGGSIIQAKANPVVAGAAADFGHWLMTELGDASSPLAPVMLQGFKILETTLGPVMTELKSDWVFLAPYVKMFAFYIGLAAQQFMPGFSKALKESAPVLAVFAHELPYLAQAIGSFFQQIGEGSRGGAEALATLMHAISAIIVGTGYFIHFAEAGFHDFLVVIKAVTDLLGSLHVASFRPFGDLQKYVDGIAGSYGAATGAAVGFTGTIDAVTTAVQNQVDAVTAANSAWDKYFGIQMSADEANLKLHESVTALTDSIAKNGRNWDLNTKAGQANYGTLLKAIDAAKDFRDTHIAAGDSLQQEDAQYAANYKALIDQATQAGLTSAQIQDLTIHYGMLAATLASLAQLGAGGKYTNPSHIAASVAHGFTLGQGLRTGGVVSFSDAGIYRDNMGPVIQFAEPGTGMEGFVPQRGITHARAGEILAPMAGWHGYGVVDYSRMRGAPGGGGMGGGMVQLVVSAADPAGAELLKMIRIQVRDQGGSAAVLGIVN
jgi:hypothetical protein